MAQDRLRLDKIISSQLGLSRREVKALCRRGRITVDGRAVLDPAEKADPETQEISMDGQRIVYRGYVYLMLNKPAGWLSASRDPARPTVVDLAPPQFAHRDLFPVGRLDRDTTGLLLLTDDGDTAHRLLSPRRHVPKVYDAALDQPLPEVALRAFAEGVVPADGTRCAPAEIQILRQEDKPTVRIVLTQGMYHQVKRMLGVFGCGVLSLHRAWMGPISLDSSLAPGECRELTPQEREALLKAAYEPEEGGAGSP